MEQVKKPKIVYMGTPEFAVAPLNALLENGYEVAAVITVPDKQAGRGLKVSKSAVKIYAEERGLPIMQPVSLKDEEFLRDLAAIKADLFIVVAFRMLPKVVWSMPPMGTFNLHGSLLPNYRGAAPINWAIINGEKESGVTTFFINEEIDTGNILMQKRTPIAEEETVGSLYDRLMEIGASLVVETVEGITNGSLQERAQDSFDTSAIKPAPKLTKELCQINWNREAEEIGRLIRGLSPYPGTHTTLSNGEKELGLKIYKSKVIGSGECGNYSKKEAGSIVSDNKEYMDIVCKEGAIRLIEVQAAGKRRMTIKEFLTGFRNAESYQAR